MQYSSFRSLCWSHNGDASVSISIVLSLGNIGGVFGTSATVVKQTVTNEPKHVEEASGVPPPGASQTSSALHLSPLGHSPFGPQVG